MRTLLVILLLVCTHGHAGERDAYIDFLVADHGFDRAEVTALLADLRPNQEIIDRISRPAETVWTWARYQRHLVDQARIDKGKVFWEQHAETLERAADVYGVKPSMIVAIIGIETRYGEVTGRFPVLESLYTLGFHYPPRSRFFRKELTQFLLLAREEGKDPTHLNGSYAGAMGYGQFISSSYRHYAVDFNDDGVRDIWNDPVDAIGSVANYFARHRWRGDQPVALRVSLDDPERFQFDRGLKLDSTVGALTQLGMQLPQGVELEAALEAKIFSVEGAAGREYWLALHDFYVITRYNHSHLYALAAHHLALALEKQRSTQP